VSVVKRCDVPERVLLCKYRDGIGYADCYFSDVPDSVSQRAFVEAFYTTALFKLERAVLRWFAGRPSTDVEARELAAGGSPVVCGLARGRPHRRRTARCRLHRSHPIMVNGVSDKRRRERHANAAVFRFGGRSKARRRTRKANDGVCIPCVAWIPRRVFARAAACSAAAIAREAWTRCAVTPGEWHRGIVQSTTPRTRPTTGLRLPIACWLSEVCSNVPPCKVSRNRTARRSGTR